MNAEQLQQLYGGDIADYAITNHRSNRNIQQNTHNDMSLENVYSNQVANKAPISMNNISGINCNVNGLIERQVEDPLQSILNNTLTKIAVEIGLSDTDGTHASSPTELLIPKQQNQNDINHAQDVVANAIAELKALEAL